MSGSVNRVILVGNLTRDPELRALARRRERLLAAPGRERQREGPGHGRMA